GRIPILGPGGIGKTTLALRIFHEVSVTERYPRRYFISCESSNTCAELIRAVGVGMGLELSSHMGAEIVKHLTRSGPTLLILDNREFAVEPPSATRWLIWHAEATNFTQVTMRGAERPLGVKWTRPFLPPLEPLSLEATRQVFVDIADEPVEEETPALDELANLSDGLPLAISLMANIAAFEGYSGTLGRWNLWKTAILSEGYEKSSNLDQSIALSLNSPRITSPHAQILLSLLSVLPDGIANHEIIGSRIPLNHLALHRTSLLRTSLAYVDQNCRLRVLVPVREYIRKAQPPP
ncbi:hypothetical protein B0H13DRAFT_1451615, partial [Mycena leptocephala]